MKPLKYNLDYAFLFSWFGITAAYSTLFFIFLDRSGHVPSMGGYIAGFFGLFTPIGPLSLLVGFISPVFILSNSVSLVLILLMALFGNKISSGKITKILVTLTALLSITFVADYLRGDFGISWWIFTHGYFRGIN